MPFLPPSQLRRCTEGTMHYISCHYWAFKLCCRCASSCLCDNITHLINYHTPIIAWYLVLSFLGRSKINIIAEMEKYFFEMTLAVGHVRDNWLPVEWSLVWSSWWSLCTAEIPWQRESHVVSTATSLRVTCDVYLLSSVVVKQSGWRHGYASLNG